MEIFVEHMVVRKPSIVSTVLKFVIVIICAVLAVILFLVSLSLGDWSFLGVLLIVAVIYGGWYLLKHFHTEFEYILTNYDLDIDKITARTRRKRIISLDLKNLEIMAPVNEKYQKELNSSNIKQKIDASSGDINSECFLKVMSAKNGLILLLFSPDERVIHGIKTMAPRKVYDL